MNLCDWIEIVNDEFSYDERLIKVIEDFYESEDNNYATSIDDVNVYDAIEWQMKKDWLKSL